MRRIVYSLAAGTAVIVVAAFFLWTWQGSETAVQAENPTNTTRSPATDSSDVIPVSTIRPAVEELRRVTTQPAQIEPFEQTDVYAKAAGFAAKVLVDIGDKVVKDQVLAELWIPEMDEEQLRKAALVEQAQAAIVQAQARLDSTAAMIAAAEAGLAETQAAITQYEAEVEFRRSEHARIVSLVKSRSVNEAIQDEKLQQLRSSEASLSASRARVRTSEANIKVEQARHLTARADLSHARSQLKVAEAELRQTEILIQYAHIRAPYAGLVTRRWVDTGDFVSSAASTKSDPVLTVNSFDKLRIVFHVPEAESALVREGQPVSLVVDAMKGRSFEGQVMRTAGVLDSKTRTLRVEAEVNDSENRLRAGMYGMITVTLTERSKAVMLPVRSLHQEGRASFVMRVKGGVVEKQTVKLGYSDGIRTEIVDGVSAEDQIIVEARVPIHPGQKVRPTVAK